MHNIYPFYQDKAILEGFGSKSETDTFNYMQLSERELVNEEQLQVQSQQSARILQFDGADDDDDVKDEVKEEPIPIEIKTETVKQEPKDQRETASVESVSSAEVASRPSTAGFINTSRGPTPLRTITPLMDLEGDIPGSVVDSPVLCPDCGNAYSHKTTYDAHLPNCANLLLKLCQKVEQEDIKPIIDDKSKLNLSLGSEGSPRKDFSIHGLLAHNQVNNLSLITISFLISLVFSVLFLPLSFLFLTHDTDIIRRESRWQ